MTYIITITNIQPKKAAFANKQFYLGAKDLVRHLSNDDSIKKEILRNFNGGITVGSESDIDVRQKREECGVKEMIEYLKFTVHKVDEEDENGVVEVFVLPTAYKLGRWTTF